MVSKKLNVSSKVNVCIEKKGFDYDKSTNGTKKIDNENDKKFFFGEFYFYQSQEG